MSDYKRVFSILERSHQLTMLEQLSRYTHFQRLIATVLSARTKDITVIPIVKELFKIYPGAKELTHIPIKELEHRLYRIGFYRVKARNIKKLSAMILKEFQGKVPSTLEEMITLPGVGRKTANCMLNYSFNKPAIAVDVHVHRISNRLGWTKTKTPEETEQELMRILPKELWNKVNMLLVDYGQRVCLPLRPRCGECKVRKYCEYGKEQ
ncbi:MAG: endonuclease III [Candidatus Woesearchaeota archaeon]